MLKLILVAVTFLSVNAFAKDVVITQKDKKFDKTEITIDEGDTIKFKNEETNVTHNVYSLGPKNAFDLLTQPPGKESPQTFKEAGATDVECAIHPEMKLKVTVKKK